MKYAVLAGVLVLAACTDGSQPTFNTAISGSQVGSGGASALQIRAATRARQFGVVVAPQSLSTAQAARILRVDDSSENSDGKIRNQIRRALGPR